MALIPVVIALVGVALLTGSLPALWTGGLTSLASSGDLPVSHFAPQSKPRDGT